MRRSRIHGLLLKAFLYILNYSLICHIPGHSSNRSKIKQDFSWLTLWSVKSVNCFAKILSNGEWVSLNCANVKYLKLCKGRSSFKMREPIHAQKIKRRMLPFRISHNNYTYVTFSNPLSASIMILNSFSHNRLVSLLLLE